MKEINLFDNNLTELTEEDLISLCQLKGFKPEKLEDLNLANNYLTNIDFITEHTPFKKIEILKLWSKSNKITDISNIKYLVNLKELYISNLKLDNKKQTIEILKNLKNLKLLHCFDTFRNYTKEQLQKELPNIKTIEC